LDSPGHGSGDVKRSDGLAPASALLALLAFVALLGSWAVLTVETAAAQPSLGELRRDLAALEENRPSSVPEGTALSIRYLIETARRIEGDFPTQAESWRRRAGRYLEAARGGTDPYPAERGNIVNRAYPQEISRRTQGYAIYLPPDYDPSRPWPVMVVLHGGSSNGNLFLGVVLGQNMSWQHYSEYIYDDFVPRWSPNVIVVAPDGFGQVLWRWMGEDDVLAVIEDVRRHYNVDDDRVILSGLSNGGLGAYALGARHSSRFSLVQAIAGAPSWLQYAGGRPLPVERTAMLRFSGMDLIENTTNTDFRFYHGDADTGPMRPEYVRQLEARMRRIGIEPNVTWYEAGHDILYRVHRHGRTFNTLATTARNRSPEKVINVTGDYRANRQHWVTVTRIEDYPELARVAAEAEAGALEVTTDNVTAFTLDLRDAPIGTGNALRIVVDERVAYDGPRAPLGHVISLVRDDDGAFAPGFIPTPDEGYAKAPGSAGPLTDAYHGRSVHVYGTGDPEQTRALQRAAQRGSRGWPLWLWAHQQEVIADSAVTPELARSAHLVLYGTPGTNSVLERIKDRLPVRVTEGAVVLGSQRFEGDDVGVRFIHPNPEAPHRYVVVQAGVTPGAVAAGHNLPDFLPDYLVYDERTTRSRSRLATGRNRPLAIGYFDGRWGLPPSPVPGEGGWAGPGDGGLDAGQSADGDASTDASMDASADTGPELLIPITPPPPNPPPPARLAVPRSDPAGLAARQIARRSQNFQNFRALVPGATWREAPRRVWQIRREAQCHEALREAGVAFRPLGTHPTPIASPVEILGPVDGVWFRMIHDDRPFTLSCEMALRLPVIARIVKRHGVSGVDVMSAYRHWPRQSFHTMGLGLDLARFWTEDGWLSVNDHFVETPAQYTCEAAEPEGPGDDVEKAKKLLRIACALYRSGRFSSVLTPNYNDGHRDHFHLDTRPDDPRLYLR